MLKDNRLRTIDDHLRAPDVFPGVGLKGGVRFFLWDRENPGLCRVSTHFKDWQPSQASRKLLENGVDVFIRFNEGLSILKKSSPPKVEKANPAPCRKKGASTNSSVPESPSDWKPHSRASQPSERATR